MKSIFNHLKMKNSLWLLMLTLVLASLFNLTTIFPVYAADDPKVFIDPKDSIYYTSEKGIDDTIQINLTIANTTGIMGFQFEIRWNSSLLVGESMVENLYATVTPPSEIGNIWQLQHSISASNAKYAYTYQNGTRAIEQGYAPINITLAEGYPEGKLAAAIITLRIIAEPPPNEFLDCTIEITTSKPGDKDGQLISHTVEDGYYKLAAPPLPTPILKVKPEIYEATHRNETFDINITINNVDASWKVIGVEFKLRYDPTLLTIKSVTEGPFMAAFAGPPNQGTQFMVPPYGSDYVWVGILILPDENGTWHEAFPSGNGIIATITFQVIQGPPVSCDFELFDTKLGDTEANPINHTVEDGVFTFSVETLYHNIESFVIVTRCNASISPVPMLLLQEHELLTFNVSGGDDAVCFVNITIPNNFLWLEGPADYWLVWVGGFRVTQATGGNGTHTWLYFTFLTSLKPVQIQGTGVIPEFTTNTLLILSLLLTAFTVAIIKVFYPWRRKKTLQ